MEVLETSLKDLVLLKPKVFGDDRGYFSESFKASDFPDFQFIQDNQSKSKYGTIRGLHYQIGEFAQTKLVRVISGKILDVAVDIREDSPTFGKSFSVELSEENFLQLLIPKGFAHGFSVLSKTAVVCYKIDNHYSPENERGILYNDPKLGIDWQIPSEDILLSDKDKKLPLLK